MPSPAATPSPVPAPSVAPRLGVAAAGVDPFAPLRFLVGDWQGESDGKLGKATVKRSYRFVLGESFLQGTDASSYPQPPPYGRDLVNEHWSFLSVDPYSFRLELRLLRANGAVEQFALASKGPEKLVFESKAGLLPTTKARLTYELYPPDTFIERIEAARDDGPFEVWTATFLQRAGAPK